MCAACSFHWGHRSSSKANCHYKRLPTRRRAQTRKRSASSRTCTALSRGTAWLLRRAWLQDVPKPVRSSWIRRCSPDFQRHTSSLHYAAACFQASGGFEESLTNLTVTRRRCLELEKVTSIPGPGAVCDSNVRRRSRSITFSLFQIHAEPIIKLQENMYR